MKVFWENAEKIILIREVPESCSRDEYQSSIQKMPLMPRQVSHKVFIIKDCRELRSFPQGFMIYFREGNRNIPSHVGMRILISENTLFQARISNLQKIAPEDFANYYCVPTLEDAHKLIREAQIS